MFFSWAFSSTTRSAGSAGGREWARRVARRNPARRRPAGRRCVVRAYRHPALFGALCCGGLTLPPVSHSSIRASPAWRRDSPSGCFENATAALSDGELRHQPKYRSSAPPQALTEPRQKQRLYDFTPPEPSSFRNTTNEPSDWPPRRRSRCPVCPPGAGDHPVPATWHRSASADVRPR